jgi:hypothetical protein
MPHIALSVLFIAIAPVAVTMAADPPKDARVDEQAKAEKARKRFFSEWLEIERLEGGTKITDPEKLFGQQFTPDGTGTWARRGELSVRPEKPGPRVDTTVTPMRVDFFSRVRTPESAKNRNAFVIREDEIMTVVHPCIFKFEDGNLVIAEGDTRVPERELKKGEDYPGRPTDFTSTKENKRTVTTMKPCSFWDQD